MSKTTFEMLRLVDRIDRADLSAGASALLSFILRVQRDGKWHIATGEALAAALKVSRRSILRYLQELRLVGLIAVWERKAVVDGSRRYIAFGYRVLVEAVREAAKGGFARRTAVVVAKMQEAVRRRKAATARASSCDKLSQMTPSLFIPELWDRLGKAREGSPHFEECVAALIGAGQGEKPADFVGLGWR